jgi:hypothetical protein
MVRPNGSDPFKELLMKPVHLAYAALACSLAAVAGCANGQRGPGNTSVMLDKQTITLQGCRPDLVTVWDRNATVKTGDHTVTVDDNYLTVDGAFSARPKFKTITLDCSRDEFRVLVDGKPFHGRRIGGQ